MTKSEADKILLAGKKFGVSVTLHNAGGDYEVTLADRITFCSFEAAKLCMNALVIEKRERNKTKENLPGLAPQDPNDSGHKHSKKKKGEINWAEGRMKDSEKENQNEVDI
jgi:hypothetical protein